MLLATREGKIRKWKLCGKCYENRGRPPSVKRNYVALQHVTVPCLVDLSDFFSYFFEQLNFLVKFSSHLNRSRI